MTTRIINDDGSASESWYLRGAGATVASRWLGPSACDSSAALSIPPLRLELLLFEPLWSCGDLLQLGRPGLFYLILILLSNSSLLSSLHFVCVFSQACVGVFYFIFLTTTMENKDKLSYFQAVI